MVLRKWKENVYMLNAKRFPYGLVLIVSADCLLTSSNARVSCSAKQ